MMFKNNCNRNSNNKTLNAFNVFQLDEDFVNFVVALAIIIVVTFIVVVVVGICKLFSFLVFGKKKKVLI